MYDHRRHLQNDRKLEEETYCIAGHRVGNEFSRCPQCSAPKPFFFRWELPEEIFKKQWEFQ